MRAFRTNSLALAAIVATAFLAPAGAAPAEETPSTTTVETGGVSGRVFFGAGTPPIRKIQVSLDQGVCGATKMSPQFVISDSKGLGNVVVKIEGVEAPAGAEAATEVSVEQQACEYGPHVQAIHASEDGVKLHLFNRDGILHNVHGWVDDETVFNFAQPGMMQELQADLTVADGVINLLCDVHDWMSSYVVMVPHPFFSVTDADGNFQIDGLAPGSYKITAWHEALGTLEKTVDITEGGTADLDFEILPR